LAQNRYVHRDVKPMNIIQRTDSDYVLIDAGIALDRDGEAITLAGDVVGTPLYISPDQFKFPQKQLRLSFLKCRSNRGRLRVAAITDLHISDCPTVRSSIRLSRPSHASLRHFLLLK
jgi:serine/threonine protein kinase